MIKTMEVIFDEPVVRCISIVIVAIIIIYFYVSKVHYGYYCKMKGYPIIKKEKLKVIGKNEFEVCFSNNGREERIPIIRCEIEFVEKQEQMQLERIETVDCYVHKRWFHKDKVLLTKPKITYKLYVLETMKIINYTSLVPFLIKNN